MHSDLRDFLAHLAITYKSSETIKRYGAILDDLDHFTLGAAPTSLDRPSLQRFASAPRRDGRARSPAGVNLRVAVVRAFFRFLVDAGRCTSSPASGLIAVPERRRTPKYLTTAEVVRLVEHVSRTAGVFRERNIAIVITLWQTAFRVSELQRLRSGQLDRDARLLRDVLLKGGHVVDVALNDETLAVLDRYLESRSELAPDAPIFARRDGKPLSVRAIQALFERWKRELGWTRALHPHVLRHTHATGALAEGVEIAVVADLLRHKGLRQVMVYAFVQDGARRDGLRRLGRLVPRSVLGGGFPVAGSGWTHTVPPKRDGGSECPCVEGPYPAAA